MPISWAGTSYKSEFSEPNYINKYYFYYFTRFINNYPHFGELLRHPVIWVERTTVLQCVRQDALFFSGIN